MKLNIDTHFCSHVRAVALGAAMIVFAAGSTVVLAASGHKAIEREVARQHDDR